MAMADQAILVLGDAAALAEALLRRLGQAGVPAQYAGAGSDAHQLADIGSVYVEMEDFEGAQDFLAKLRRGKIHRRGLRDKLRRP